MNLKKKFDLNHMNPDKYPDTSSKIDRIFSMYCNSLSSAIQGFLMDQIASMRSNRKKSMTNIEHFETPLFAKANTRRMGACYLRGVWCETP
jgi:hypothetical protein